MNKGFGLIETIVAMGLFVIIAVSGATTVVGSFSVNRLAQEEVEAKLYAQEGIEAARSIRNQGWSNPFLATDCSGGCGLDNSGGSWVFSGTSNSMDGYTRVVSVQQAQRDGGGEIVESGGTADADTYKVTSQVNWDFTPSRNNTVSLITYLTNFVKNIIGDWSGPSVEGTPLDIGGNQNGTKIQVANDWAFVVRTGGNNFVAIDISNTASPSEIDSLSLDGTPDNLVLSTDGNYAFVVSSDNDELQTVDLSDPSSLDTGDITYYSLNGGQNANGIDISGNHVYIVRNNTTNYDIVAVDISTPTSPSAVGNTDVGGGTNNEVVVLDTHAYIASSNNSEELRVVNVSNPASLSDVTGYNLSGNSNALTIAGFGSTVVVGRANGDLYLFDVSTPSSPVLLNTTPYDAGSAIRDISLGNENQYAFLGTDDNTNEFQVVDISSPSTPSLLGSVNLNPNNDLNGIAYHPDKDRAFGVGEQNSEEFVVFQPN